MNVILKSLPICLLFSFSINISCSSETRQVDDMLGYQAGYSITENNTQRHSDKITNDDLDNKQENINNISKLIPNITINPDTVKDKTFEKTGSNNSNADAVTQSNDKLNDKKTDGSDATQTPYNNNERISSKRSSNFSSKSTNSEDYIDAKYCNKNDDNSFLSNEKYKIIQEFVNNIKANLQPFDKITLDTKDNKSYANELNVLNEITNDTRKLHQYLVEKQFVTKDRRSFYAYDECDINKYPVNKQQRMTKFNFVNKTLADNIIPLYYEVFDTVLFCQLLSLPYEPSNYPNTLIFYENNKEKYNQLIEMRNNLSPSHTNILNTIKTVKIIDILNYYLSKYKDYCNQLTEYYDENPEFQMDELINDCIDFIMQQLKQQIETVNAYFENNNNNQTTIGDLLVI